MLGTRGRLAWTPGAAVMTKRGGASRAAAHRTRAAPRRATTRARRRQPDGSGNIRTDGEQAVAGGSVEPVEPGPTLPCPDRDRRLRRARADEAAGVGVGPLLAGLADRLPRRRLMVSCDLARGLVVAVMAAPGAPLWLLCALLVGAVLLTAPFTAARAALLPDVLPDDRYVLASAINNITDQGAQVLGFAVGGGLAAVLGSSMTLGIDAATFVASALLL